MKKLIIFSLIIGLMPLILNADEEKTPSPSTIESPSSTINGKIVIKDNSIFLLASDKQIYKINAESNPEIYKSLFELITKKNKINKGLEAKLSGHLGASEKRIKTKNEYSHQDTVIQEKKEELNYINFDILTIENTSEFPFENITLTTSSPTKLKVEIPPLRNIRGKVLAVNFKSIIPSIEIERETTKEVKTIIIPSHIDVIKEVEGQVLILPAEKSIKVGTKIDCWFNELQNMNQAQSLVVLP